MCASFCSSNVVHQRLEVPRAADLPHVLGREVGVEARAVPVDLGPERLGMEVDVDAVALAEPQEQVARDPQLVGGPPRALAEDLELPLALRHLGVDPHVLDAGLEAEVEMLVDDRAGERRRRSGTRRRCSTRPAGAGSRRPPGSRAAPRPCRGSTPARSRTTCPGSSGIVARLFDGCGVPSGSMTSHITRAPFSRAGSGKSATGCSMQSESLPSAWRVELPSKPQIGSSSRVGNSSNSTTFVFPRMFGTGS